MKKIERKIDRRRGRERLGKLSHAFAYVSVSQTGVKKGQKGRVERKTDITDTLVMQSKSCAEYLLRVLGSFRVRCVSSLPFFLSLSPLDFLPNLTVTIIVGQVALFRVRALQANSKRTMKKRRRKKNVKKPK